MNPGPTIRTLTLCAALLLLSVSALTAQVADLPIKPGLWNTQVVLKMGADDKDTRPISQQACFTAGSTISGYLTAITKSLPDIKCTVASKVQTGHHLIFDTVCTGPTISSKAHHDFNLADPDHFSGSSHTSMTGSMQGHPVNMEMSKTFTGTFVSTDCGSVKPLDLTPPSPPQSPDHLHSVTAHPASTEPSSKATGSTPPRGETPSMSFTSLSIPRTYETNIGTKY